jgi:non-ribosomal peptide synthetase component E (peptide arylation enzyme)
VSERRFSQEGGGLVVAHRGDSAHEAENTIPAFESAIVAGASEGTGAGFSRELAARGHELEHAVIDRRTGGRRRNLGLALDANGDATAAEALYRDDLAIWLFTSGSTGNAKAAVHLQHDLPYNTECYAKRVLGINKDDITLSVPKLFFGYATGTNLLFPFAVGGATASSRTSSAAVQACVLLPDTKSSVRWETADRPFLEDAFKAAGLKGAMPDGSFFQPFTVRGVALQGLTVKVDERIRV